MSAICTTVNKTKQDSVLMRAGKDKMDGGDGFGDAGIKFSRRHGSAALKEILFAGSQQGARRLPKREVIKTDAMGLLLVARYP